MAARHAAVAPAPEKPETIIRHAVMVPTTHAWLMGFLAGGAFYWNLFTREKLDVVNPPKGGIEDGITAWLDRHCPEHPEVLMFELAPALFGALTAPR